MKKEIIAVVVAAVVFGGMAYVSAAKTEIKPKQEKGILIGEVIDIAGYGMFGRLGKENIEAGKYRASHGFPVGILEEVDGGHLDRPLQASSARSGYARRPTAS